ncbi:MAG: hypothetical protein K2M23_00230, partial [Alphaproteobacteria bacterium]|nr:hypothetical protein [Alphaproteobacteria bacterium]
DGPIENVFSTLYTQLKDSIDKVNNDLNTAKTELLTKIKEVDSSITDFPLSLEALMNYYKLEQSILKAIGSVEYINPPNATTNEYTAHSIYDTSGKQSVKFEYNEDTKDYSLVLTDIGTGTNHKQNRTVRFQPSDFVSNSGYYKAEKTITDGKSTVSYTYLPDLKNYITAGGTLDIFARKNNATNIIKKVLYNSAPTQTDINDFNKWFGTTLATDSVLTEDIKSSAQLVIKMLEKADTNFDITQTNTITDIVKLGGKSLNLSYSDFGLWTVKGATQYSGDNDLINAKKDTEAKSSYYYIDNPFYSGLDEFKVGFKEQSGVEINSSTKFSGTAIASASKDNVRKDLTGTALLNINNQTAKGDINLSFDSWYGFAFNNIDFSSNNGFSLNNAPVTVSGKSSGSDITITATTDTIKGNVAGALYGPNATTPVEGVGNYNITTGDNVKIDGAFGVKK